MLPPVCYLSVSLWCPMFPEKYSSVSAAVVGLAAST